MIFLYQVQVYCPYTQVEYKVDYKYCLTVRLYASSDQQCSQHKKKKKNRDRTVGRERGSCPFIGQSCVVFRVTGPVKSRWGSLRR